MSEAPVVIVGGGIAGIAAAVDLADAGERVLLLEKRAFLGGRATSFVDKETGEEIDNCQHVVLGCCTNVLDLFDRLEVADRIEFTDTFWFVEPGGARHVLKPSSLPAPLHYLPSLLRFGALTPGERWGIVRAFLTMMHHSATGLRRLRDDTVAEWLAARRQSDAAVRRFWDPILVSAVNESMDRAAALPCLQVFLQGFLPHRDAARMGVPTAGLNSLYSEPAVRYLEARGSEVRTRCGVRTVLLEGRDVTGVELLDGTTIDASRVILAVPPEALGKLVPGTPAAARDAVSSLETSPITGIHLWFDREVLDLPHAFVLDSTIQWVFAKPVDDVARARGAAQRVQVVVSASRALRDLGQAEIIERAAEELAEAFPAARDARLIRGVVVKENRATISVLPSTEPLRPPAATEFPGLVLAGDWTRSGWPATLEGAVRSGRRAAAIVRGEEDAGLVPDLVRGSVARLLMRRTPRTWPTIERNVP